MGSPFPSTAGDDTVKIGVWAPLGEKPCMQKWGPTADYLTDKIAGYRFEIIPLAADEIEPAVKREYIDFLLSNPAQYVTLEMTVGINAIATLNNHRLNGGNIEYGGVIISRAESDIAHLEDLPNRHFMAVNEHAFCGWTMVRREFKKTGLDPIKQFASLSFGGTSHAVVEAVLEGEVDAGSLNSHDLKMMEIQNELDISGLRIVSPRQHPIYPYAHSTELYPEWPFSRMQHVPIELGRQVSLSLLAMPADSPAAVAGDYTGWVAPQNYRSVNDCLRELKIGPYIGYGQVTLGQALRQHWGWGVGIFIIFAVISGFLIHVVQLNKKLENIHRVLSQELAERRKLEKIKTRLIGQLQDALAQVKTLKGLIPICSSCKKIRDDHGYWHQVEVFITNCTDAKFSHSVCMECMQKLYPDFVGKLVNKKDDET